MAPQVNLVGRTAEVYHFKSIDLLVVYVKLPFGFLVVNLRTTLGSRAHYTLRRIRTFAYFKEN